MVVVNYWMSCQVMFSSTSKGFEPAVALVCHLQKFNFTACHPTVLHPLSIEKAAVEQAEKEHVVTIANYKGVKWHLVQKTQAIATNIRHSLKHSQTQLQQPLALLVCQNQGGQARPQLKVKISEASKMISDSDSSSNFASCGLEANLPQYISAKEIPWWLNQGMGSSDASTLVSKLNKMDASIMIKFDDFNLDSSNNSNDEELFSPLQTVTPRSKPVKPPLDDNYEGTPSPSQPWVPSGVTKRRIEETQLASQIPFWYDDYKVLGSLWYNEEKDQVGGDSSQLNPPLPQVPSGVMKRKIKKISHSDVKDEEMAGLGMEIDTNMPHEPEVRTMASTSVTIMHADHDAQLMLKKAKIEPEDTLLRTKTRNMGITNKSCSDYKNSDLPVPTDQKWMNIFIDTVILWAGKIFSTVYPNVQYEVTIQSAVFGVKGYDMESIIALASAVLKHAFTLICDGVIDIWGVVKEMAEKKEKITLPKMLNKVTGNMSKNNSMFSINN
ncbi:hypothetical protein HD554DRAFT_2036028 [Boletus coccyginus]|nr:hypothetical protein HD554DRAFT_2036028 [Boletus coccyginus]